MDSKFRVIYGLACFKLPKRIQIPLLFIFSPFKWLYEIFFLLQIRRAEEFWRMLTSTSGFRLDAPISLASELILEKGLPYFLFIFFFSMFQIHMGIVFLVSNAQIVSEFCKTPM